MHQGMAQDHNFGLIKKKKNVCQIVIDVINPYIYLSKIKLNDGFFHIICSSGDKLRWQSMARRDLTTWEEREYHYTQIRCHKNRNWSSCDDESEPCALWSPPRWKTRLHNNLDKWRLELFSIYFEKKFIIIIRSSQSNDFVFDWRK